MCRREHYKLNEMDLKLLPPPTFILVHLFPNRLPDIVFPVSARILQSARVISLLTLVSRLLGLVRDMACAAVFPLEGIWSAFALAFQIPNLFRRLFGEGALSAASIPVLTETLTHEGPEAVDRLAGKLLSLLITVLVCICLLAEIVVASLYFLGKNDNLTLSLTALLLPYMILVCTVATLSGLQNVFARFALPAFMPCILNLFMIAAVLGASWLIPGNTDGQLRQKIFVLALAIIVAGTVQVAWQWFAVRRLGLRLRLALDLRDPSIRRILATMLPMIVGLGAAQINALADTLIAYWFVKTPTGEAVGPGILWYAQRLYQLPLGIFAIALATAIFPALSRHAAEKDFVGLSQNLSRGLVLAAFETIPCLVGLILISEPLVQMIFDRGQFSEFPNANGRVAFALNMYAIGIGAFAFNHLILRAFYALQDATTPLKIAVVNIVLNLGLNLWLVNTFMQEAGLALATTLCAFIQTTFLLFVFNRRIGHIQWASIIRGTSKVLLAVSLMAAAVLAVDRYAANEWRSLPRLSMLVVTGAATYLAAAWLLRSNELRELLRR